MREFILYKYKFHVAIVNVARTMTTFLFEVVTLTLPATQNLHSKRRFVCFPLPKSKNVNQPQPPPPPPSLSLSFSLFLSLLLLASFSYSHFLDLSLFLSLFAVSSFNSMAAVAAASVGGGMTEPPTQQMDALRSESVVDAPSSSISAANGLDRTGSSNSSPSHPKDAEIEVMYCLFYLNCFRS